MRGTRRWGMAKAGFRGARVPHMLTKVRQVENRKVEIAVEEMS